MRPQGTANEQASAALAARMRDARDETWDDDRCAYEAQRVVALMHHHGWRHQPDTNFRTTAPGTAPRENPRVQAELDAARELLRDATRRHTPIEGAAS